MFIGQDDVAHFTKFGLMIRDEVTAFIAGEGDSELCIDVVCLA